MTSNLEQGNILVCLIPILFYLVMGVITEFELQARLLRHALELI